MFVAKCKMGYEITLSQLREFKCTTYYNVGYRAITLQSTISKINECKIGGFILFILVHEFWNLSYSNVHKDCLATFVSLIKKDAFDDKKEEVSAGVL